MISLISSSFNAENFTKLFNSIKKTIGVPYELIKIENPGIMGICEAYNNGAAKAKYDIVCFVHDDVAFITNNWGQALITSFEKEKNIGVIGVAGSVCKSKMPSSWWQPEVNNVQPKRMNIIQKFKFDENGTTHHYINPKKENKSSVATLDGVFLAVKKEVWEKNKFDEKLLKGFHGYDIDFTINIGRTKNNYVVYDMLIEHYSEGNTNLDWLKDITSVHKKWRSFLPVTTSGDITATALKIMDRHWFNYLLSIDASTKKERKQKLALCLKLLSFLGADAIKLTDVKRFKILFEQLDEA